jgi:hypothetical protein
MAPWPAVDAAGLLLAVMITAASVQDRDAARPLLWNLHRTRENIFSDTQPPPPHQRSSSAYPLDLSPGLLGLLSRRTLAMPGPDCWARTMAG